MVTLTPFVVASARVQEARPQQIKVGAAAPPLRTDHGWLLLHHGVDETNVYRVGALLLDAADPTKLLARSVDPIFEPRAYYERAGAVIPNVVFPTALIRGDRDQLLMYYGCCDTCIAVAMTTVKRLMDSLSSV